MIGRAIVSISKGILIYFGLVFAIGFLFGPSLLRGNIIGHLGIGIVSIWAILSSNSDSGEFDEEEELRALREED